MGQFTLIKRNGTRIPLNKRIPFCAVKTAQQSRSLMADDTVTLEVVSTFLIDFEKGDKIKIDSDWYTIRTTVDRTKNSEDQYNYSITLYGCIYDLMKVMFRDTDVNGRSTSLTFDLTYSIKDFVKVIIYNMNRDYPGEWVFDDKDCPETEPKTVSFSCQNCLQTLQNECKDFDVDFQITTDKDGIHHIKIGKFGSVVTPPNGEKYFQWGRGHGLFTLVEGKVDDKAIITRMYGEGGTNNIPTAYRDYSERLQLPYPQRLNKHDHKLSDGTVVKAKTMQIGCTDDNKRYIEDTDLSKKIGVEEDAIQNDEIYPKRTGTVTALGDDVYTFMDDTMDFDLKASNSNGTTYLIDGTSAKITFITGRLAGREFELHDYDHSAKKFILKPYKDARGLVFPTSNTTAFQIKEGDQYKITDIIMPDSYIEDAEEDLWFYVYDKFLQAKQARAQYALTFSRSYFIENMPKDSDSCLFTPGDYVPIKDERFNLEKNIRIQKVERNLLLRHDYTLTISDTATISIINQAVINVQKHDTILEANRLKDLTRAKYGWRTTEELRNMIYDPDGYFDTDNIKPNSIDTNMLTVGSKSQQFVLADVIMQANLGGDPNLFKATSGTLCHLSISDTDIRYWKIAALDATLSEAGGYYLFAKCSKKGDTGSWYLTKEQLKFEPTSDPNNYYFQVGVLSSVYDANWRDFVTTYGFTRINGNTITTGKIVTSDGYCYLDLDGNKFRMGDKQSYIDYNVQQRGQITLHNVRLLSTSGDSSEIGVFRGEYNASYVYYKGDEVTYTNNGVTATYRYIYSEPTKGYAPTMGTYWQCIAKGKDGEAGETPKIGDNGNWWIGSVDTGIKAEGVDGKGVNILGSYDSEAELKAAHPKGSPGDAYIVAGDLYSWDDVHKVWKNAGRIKGDAGDTPYIMNGYWWIGATNTGVKAKGEDAVMYEILPSVRIYSDTMVAAGDSLRVSLNKITGSNTENLTSLPKGFSLTLFGYGTDHIGKPTSKAISLDTSYKLSDLKTSLKANMSLEVVLAGTNQVIITKISMPYVKDGEKGTPGAPGEDGRTSYTHFKYSNDGGLSFTGNNGEEPGSYLGQYTDFEEMDSSDPTRYTWALIQGEAGNSGVDAAASSYFECRYAKNGSTVEPPTLDATALEPTGWSLQMPSVGKLEYLWMSMAQKSKLVEQTYCHIPFTAKDGCKDITGNYATELGSGGSIVTEGDRQFLSLPDDSDLRIKYDLPFGENFTLFFWFKTDQKKIGWAIQDASFTLNMKEMDVKPGTWMHLAFRFSDRTVSCFLNGVRQATASLNKKLIGFTIYDSNMYASANCYDEFRMVNGALADVDIVKVYQDKADKLLSNWSVPTRISPYDGKDGVSIMARYSSDKQNWHTSFQTGDQWMQTSSDSGKTWGEACKIVGEAGTNGKDGRDGIDGKDGRDGTDGYSLAPIYRGEYSASKTYYGTQYRVDIVKYNGIYYVARVDAGTFSNVAPTNTSKWNPFGAQFESIATNLLLAEGANIGDWFLSGGKIVSTLSTTSSGKITLNAKGGLIQVESATSGGDHSLYTSMGAKITLDANRGVIQATAKNAPSYSTGTAYMSPSGIFANMAGTDSISASTGRTHRSAIVGLGFANVSKSAYELNADETLVAGVYGRADNLGTAPAYGGYFWDLKACGLILNTKFISDNSTYSERCLSKSVSFVIGLCNRNVVKDVWLPNDTKNGRIIKFKQMGAGGMRVRPMSGQHIYDDTSENDYYDCGEGQCLEFVFGIWVKGSTTTNVWTVSKYKF